MFILFLLDENDVIDGYFVMNDFNHAFSRGTFWIGTPFVKDFAITVKFAEPNTFWLGKKFDKAKKGVMV